MILSRTVTNISSLKVCHWLHLAQRTNGASPCTDTRLWPCSWSHLFLILIVHSGMLIDSLFTEPSEIFLLEVLWMTFLFSPFDLGIVFFTLLDSSQTFSIVYVLAGLSQQSWLCPPCFHITLYIDCANVFHCYDSFASFSTNLSTSDCMDCVQFFFYRQAPAVVPCKLNKYFWMIAFLFVD